MLDVYQGHSIIQHARARFLCILRAQKAILGPPPPPPPSPLTPTKVFKVEYSHQTLVENTWLGSNMLVGGCYIGPKMAIWCSCARFLCTLRPTAVLGLPPAPPIEVSDANQSFQGRVQSLDVGSKLLVGFKYVGGGVLNRPQNGNLVHLRTIFAMTPSRVPPG